MGRMAGYTGKKITWEQALNSEEDLMPKNLDMNGKMDFPPIAKPGKTFLVPVTVAIGGEVHFATASVLYKATQGKSGKAKK